MEFWNWLTLFNVAALAILWGVYRLALRIKDEHIKELKGQVFALEELLELDCGGRDVCEWCGAPCSPANAACDTCMGRMGFGVEGVQ